MRSRAVPACLAAALILSGCSRPPDDARFLPTGARLDAAGRSIALGSMPLAMEFSPDSARIVVLLSGLREQGIQVVDPVRRVVAQTLVQPGAFLGLCFATDGKSLYASGGGEDVVYRYAWAADSAVLADSIPLAPRGAVGKGVRFPSGLGIAPDGRHLY